MTAAGPIHLQWIDDASQALRVYAGFLVDLNNDVETAQNMMNKADEMEERQRHLAATGEKKDDGGIVALVPL